MDKIQTAQVNSIAKSDDFLDDRAADVSSIPQIAIEATKLHNVLEKILDADAIGSRNNIGISISKKEKRETLEAAMRKVGKSGSAYFYSIGESAYIGITGHTANDLSRMATEEILVRARDLHNLLLPHAAVLIGATAADLTALNDAKEALADEWDDPKRAVEISKSYNDAIPGYIKEAMKIRQGIDIYMQTFEDDDPQLYAEWKLSMGIDDAATGNPPVLEIPMPIPQNGDTITIDYNGVAMQGNTQIKVTNAGPSIVEYGFGNTPNTFVGSPKAVAVAAAERNTAASLQYDAAQARFLNIRISAAAQADTQVLVAFYEMV